MMTICAQHIFTFAEFGSECFGEFLTVLGEKIRLKGWERFRGGLDVKGWLVYCISCSFFTFTFIFTFSSGYQKHPIVY